jgi:hypothetical protein
MNIREALPILFVSALAATAAFAGTTSAKPAAAPATPAPASAMQTDKTTKAAQQDKTTHRRHLRLHRTATSTQKGSNVKPSKKS